MREIKFRAWNIETKTTTDWTTIRKYKKFEKLMSLNHVVLMQYTGLKDKNIETQKEVYDGDILQFVNGNIGTVEWDYKNTGWIVRSTKNKMRTHNLVNSLLLGALVIGNIYENPELLEEK